MLPIDVDDDEEEEEEEDEVEDEEEEKGDENRLLPGVAREYPKGEVYGGPKGRTSRELSVMQRSKPCDAARYVANV